MTCPGSTVGVSFERVGYRFQMSWLKSAIFLSEYSAIRAAELVMRLLPLDVAVAAAGTVSGAVGPQTALHRRAQVNIAVAFPDAAPQERERILREMWRNTGRVIAETLMLDRIMRDPGRLEIVGRKELEARLAIPGPNIGITLHLGNWELVALGSALCGSHLAAVYRPLRNPYLDQLMREKRRSLYPGGLLFKGTMSGQQPKGRMTLVAVDYLKKGGHLGLVCDQVEEASSFVVPFFGVPAKFSPAPALFGRRIGSRMWIGRCVRIGGRTKFRLEIKEFAIPRSDSAESDIKAATAAMARQFEDWIRETPDQWMWWQRRSIGG
jgi:Kdo2-lipid IVA lauroyltransferase/acyltransferase